mgnify:CR=1 FL=1|jgi:hypothetical protein
MLKNDKQTAVDLIEKPLNNKLITQNLKQKYLFIIYVCLDLYHHLMEEKAL